MAAPERSPVRRAAAGRTLAALLVLAACLPGSFGAARAADEDAPAIIPPEPGAVVVPDAPTAQALTADLDGDGERELVRLVASPADGVFVEAWRVAGVRPRQIGERATVLRRSRIAGDAPVRLLAWDDGSRERLLVVSRPRFEVRDLGAPCCLVLEEPVVREGALRLVEIAAASDAVESVMALDLDGDGRDELMTTRRLPPQGDVAYPLEVGLRRFDGARFGPPTATVFPLGSGDTVFHLGDSDGEPGEEAGLIASLGSGGLLRIAWRDGELVQEHSGMVWPLTARAIVAEGRAAVVAAGGRRLAVLAWPPGRRADITAAASDLPQVVVGTLRHGDDTLLLVTEGRADALVPLSSRLVPLLGEPLAPSAPARALRGVSVLPYIGPLPLGGDDQGTFAFAGRALRWEGEGPLVRDISSLANAIPVGPMGAGEAVALLRADFFLAEPDDPRGGPLAPPAAIPGASLSVVPRHALLAAEESSRWQPAVTALGRDAEGRLLASGDGFGVEVEAPPGTLLGIRGDAEVSGPGAIGATGEAALNLRPEDAARADARSLALVARTPAGRAYVARWEVRVLAGPPRLEAVAETPPFSPMVEVRGRVAPPARLHVAGRPVETAADGAFRAFVPAPPWPTPIEVSAVDPAGNRATLRVEAVGILDYRAIPWPAVAFVGTLLVAAALFIGVPRATARRRQAEEGGRIDELRG